MEFLGLDHVQLSAPPGCEHEARHFFGEVMGLKEVKKPPALQARGGAWFQIGDQQLHVGTEDDFRPALKAHPALRVTQTALAELADRLMAAGSPVTWDDALPGTQRFFTDDPWGNRLELLATG